MTEWSKTIIAHWTVCLHCELGLVNLASVSRSSTFDNFSVIPAPSRPLIWRQLVFPACAIFREIVLMLSLLISLTILSEYKEDFSLLFWSSDFQIKMHSLVKKFTDELWRFLIFLAFKDFILCSYILRQVPLRVGHVNRKVCPACYQRRIRVTIGIFVAALTWIIAAFLYCLSFGRETWWSLKMTAVKCSDVNVAVRMHDGGECYTRSHGR